MISNILNYDNNIMREDMRPTLDTYVYSMYNENTLNFSAMRVGMNLAALWVNVNGVFAETKRDKLSNFSLGRFLGRATTRCSAVGYIYIE